MDPARGLRAGDLGACLHVYYARFDDPGLRSDGSALSVSQPVDFTFDVAVGSVRAGQSYAILASLSGALRGVALPGGILLPINPDPITAAVGSGAGGPVFPGFSGTLGSILIGRRMHFAGLVVSSVAFERATNAAAIEFVP